ncbi:MAG TPA: hypothetical protein VMF08_17630 [Candidatus Sulfotelmatobacter sp.]|nr:hypothetical protein [Candidatus Sulfotelmatobacter sp.]
MNALPTLSPPYGQMPPTFWEQHGTAVLAGGFILLALAAAVVWRILNPGPQPVLPPATVARRALEKCRVRPEDGNVLSEVSQTLRRYVGAVFEFPPGEFTTAEFCRELERNEKIGPELKRALSDFLKACDERKFSPVVASSLGGAAAPPYQDKNHAAVPLNAADRALEFVGLINGEAHRQDARATKK